MSNLTHFFYALVVCMNNELVESGTPEMSKSQAATQRKSLDGTQTCRPASFFQFKIENNEPISKVVSLAITK